MITEKTVRRFELTPVALNFNTRTVSGDGTLTSSNFDVAGFNKASFFIFLDRTAVTQLDITMEISPEASPGDSTKWYPVPVETNSSGTVSAPTKTVRRATIAADTYMVALFDNIEGGRSARLKITDTNGSTDTLLVTGVLTA